MPQTAGLALRYQLSQAFPPREQESAKEGGVPERQVTARTTKLGKGDFARAACRENRLEQQIRLKRAEKILHVHRRALTSARPTLQCYDARAMSADQQPPSTGIRPRGLTYTDVCRVMTLQSDIEVLRTPDLTSVTPTLTLLEFRKHSPLWSAGALDYAVNMNLFSLESLIQLRVVKSSSTAINREGGCYNSNTAVPRSRCHLPTHPIP